jgi:LruC domain-containing protein
LISGYYKSKDNLPWGLDIPVDFDYAIEKADITQAYLKFAQWVESNGTQYQDWYLDKSGYRNSAKIYSH